MLKIGSHVLIVASNSCNGEYPPSEHPVGYSLEETILSPKSKFLGKTGIITKIAEHKSGPCIYAIQLDDIDNALDNYWLWAACEIIELTENNKEFKR